MNDKESSMNALEKRIDNLFSTDTAALLYDPDQEALEEAEMARIEEGFKALNRKLSATSRINRWGYSKSGWMSKQAVTNVMNRITSGMYAVFPIPCKQGSCPYAESCLAMQNNMQPNYGEPCVIETAKIERAITEYSRQFDIKSSSPTDRVLIQELISLDLIMDRCQILMSQDSGNPLQEVTMGVTEDGDVYTQPVISRYLEAWEKMSRRRQQLLSEMMATRKSRKGIQEEPPDYDREVITMTQSEDFFKVEERPDKFK